MWTRNRWAITSRSSSGVEPGLCLCVIPLETAWGVSLYRNRAWSEGAINAEFNATGAPNSLPVSHMDTMFHVFETRPVLYPLRFGPRGPVNRIAFLLPFYTYSVSFHSMFPPLKPTCHHHLPPSRSPPCILWGFGHLVWRFPFHAVPFIFCHPWWFNTEAEISSVEAWNLYETCGGFFLIDYWIFGARS